MRSPVRSRRIASTHSVSASGGSIGASAWRSAWSAVHAPGQRTKRPPDSSSSEAAVCAIATGVRRRTTCVHPRASRSVAIANALSALTESRISAMVSEKNAISQPRASTSRTQSRYARTGSAGS